jgi:hypothetical protein
MNDSEASIIPHYLHQLSTTSNDKNTQAIGGNLQNVMLVQQIVMCIMRTDQVIIL